MATPVMRLSWVLAGVASALAGAGSVHAQTPEAPAALVVTIDGESAAGRAWLARVQHSPPHGPDAEATWLTPAQLAERLALATDRVGRHELAAMGQVEQHLRAAREHSGRLDDAAALGELHQAEQELDRLLHVPGAALLYAELQTVLGLVAAQAGSVALAEAAFRRAAVIDPTRGVRAAETAPAWAARAAELGRESALAPGGEVPIDSEPRGAQVYLDDQLLGTTPLTVRARRGVHVLRVEAPGYVPLGLKLPVDAGARPPTQLRLSPDPTTTALASLADVARRGLPSEVSAAIARLSSLGVPMRSVWLLEAASARADRALVTRCTADGCDPARRLELDVRDVADSSYGQALDPAGLGRDRTARDHGWLAPDEPAPATQAEPPRAGWPAWALWTAAALVVGGGTALAVAVGSEPDTRRLRVTIDP